MDLGGEECVLYHIKELLGHETLENLKHYARLNITDLRRILEKHHPREKDD
jgi:site-specific recombinase XerD